MKIEWDESVTTARRVAMQVCEEVGPGYLPLRYATVDDLRRACEAAGLVLATAQHAEDLAKLGRELNEIVAQRDAARACADAAQFVGYEVRATLSAEERETAWQAARRVVAERDAAREEASSVLGNHALALETLRARADETIDCAARRVVAERDAARACYLACAQAVGITYETDGRAPESGPMDVVATLRARVAELEAAPKGQPVATDEELFALYMNESLSDPGRTALQAHRAGVAAVAARVRAERPACLVARTVALGCDVSVATYCTSSRGILWSLEVWDNERSVMFERYEIPAADVPGTLARLLDEVEASRKAAGRKGGA